MASLHASRIYVALESQGVTTCIKSWAVPEAGTIKAIWAGVDTPPTTGTLALARLRVAGSVNLLTATNLNLATGLSAGVAASLTLSASALNLHLEAGDIVSATWTWTTAGSATFAGCTLIFEPDLN